VRIPPKIRPRLNRAATPLLTPRSLRAFLLQLNHGECEIAVKMTANVTKGVNTPTIPAIRVHRFLRINIARPILSLTFSCDFDSAWSRHLGFNPFEYDFSTV
jgi:hypothetical protein